MIQSVKTPPTMLVILDGFGYSEGKKGNAVANARMPTWHFLQKNYPSWLLQASGRAVGLPDGFMGNSEVGHLCLGAGRVIKTVMAKFHDVVADGSFFSNPILLDRFEGLKKSGHALHIMGLLSDAGVHSHIDHLFAIIRLAKKVGVKNVYIHAFLDGRDTPPQSAETYLRQLEEFCVREKYGVLASMVGRFFAMDRDHNWGRIQQAYDLLTTPVEKNKPLSWREVLSAQYARGIYDEFIEPTLLSPDATIKPGDGIMFFNFRPDRARQLTQTFIDPTFKEFPTHHSLAFFTSTVRYSDSFKDLPNDVLFADEKIKQTLLDEIATQTKGKLVFIIAETEKYAHVTYFFRGKIEQQLPNETRELIPSLKVKSYVEHPDMSAAQITEKLLKSLRANPAYFYLVNYANCDMVGHSGDFAATVKACECVDKQLKQLFEEVVERQGGTMFIVGDHGNAEEKIDPVSGLARTSHTTNLVPFVMVSPQFCHRRPIGAGGGLANVAPTILSFLGLKIPENMTKKLEFGG